MIVKIVYHNCRVIVYGYDTLVDFIELEMVDLDIIMSMDWLASCYATIDCRTKKLHFHFPHGRVMWEHQEEKLFPMIPKGVHMSHSMS